MGSVEISKERVLLVLHQPLSPEIESGIREKLADSELTIYETELGVPVPPEIYRKATVLVTFAHLPEIQDSQNLKLIHTLSAGLDHLTHNPILKEGRIPISTSSGIHGPPIAEWTIMNWLVSSRNYDRQYEGQKARAWPDKTPYMVGNHDQAGKKVGILGYGSIGRQIARVSQALGMSVYAYTASPRKTPESKRDTGYIVPGTGDADGSIPVSWHHGTDKGSIRSFLAQGLDHLVISLPLTPQTTKVLGAKEFALLSASSTSQTIKPFITNISRGKVVDQDALIEALESGQLSGAALDVTDPEPLPADHPLWDAPNVQISPHVSGLGREYLPRSLDILKLNIQRLANGEPLINAYGGKGY
ncbi:D-isomer specific 2-hydroxyacid dehydrogenase NAD-binding [Penicillium argentinense]|uniref:D-isomer specific 2-hydroxyacid dehydrogenase NAD-binding n=1 Tax=Penicillium argentinense TaxID=1131581 RepID=A0A9W9ENU2_9EURO|nr:D-isomer specific 2-hydroxyacid dehydrogenase NAD-binding [Penicillium argentinense]KAJ5085221.1 D-isomer specific 2-hydroxyacid dehydrogenase NAD-binding [Penicillium argentinense]